MQYIGAFAAPVHTGGTHSSGSSTGNAVTDRAILLLAVLLAACGGETKGTTAPAPSATNSAALASRINAPQIPPVEFGKRPPKTPMTSENMPFFDRVAYCLATTRTTDKTQKGPAYEACVEDQEHYRIILGDAINGNKFQEANIIHCAKATRTAWQGMWFCLNGQEF